MSASTDAPPLTDRLARFAATVAMADLPAAGVERLSQCLLDFIGLTAFAGAHAESSGPIRAGLRELVGDGGPGTVVGDSRGYPYPYAALLNGSFAHSMDFDDTNIHGSLHPGAPVIPVVLACAEERDCSGAELIAALAAGYETCCRIGAALGPTAYDRGFHLTAVAGLFGAVAAGARLRGCSEQQLATAWGLAGSMAAGSMQYLSNGGWNKRLHPGMAAHNALLCLGFTESGVRGAEDPIAGPFGLLTGYSDRPDPRLATVGLGERWVLTDTAIKPYPSCRFTHGAVDVALELRNKTAAAPAREASFDLRISPRAFQIVGQPRPNKLDPGNVVDGQFSVYFQVAVALLDGEVNWSSYQRLGDPDVHALSHRIRVTPDEDLPPAGAVLTRVEPGGATDTLRRDQPRGEPGEPLSWAVIEAKYHELADGVLGRGRCEEIAAAVRMMPELTGTGRWVGMLRPGRA